MKCPNCKKRMKNIKWDIWINDYKVYQCLHCGHFVFKELK